MYIMVAIGIAVIAVSFIAEKRMAILKDKAENEGLQKLKNELELLKESTENMYYDTEDKLSKLSCRKMSELTEFSEQIIEKIALNHKEVIFLYDMLNEKDKEVKIDLGQLEEAKYDIRKMIFDINEAKDATTEAVTQYTNMLKEVELRNILVEEPLTGDDSGIVVEDKPKTTRKRTTKKTTTTKRMTKKIDEDKNEEKQLELELLNIIAQEPDGEVEPIKKATRKKISKSKTQAEALTEETDDKVREEIKSKITRKKTKTNKVLDETVSEDIFEKTTFRRPYKVENEQILELYKGGLSYVDISKKLDIGMGEVMLVVNLYKDVI